MSSIPAKSSEPQCPCTLCGTPTIMLGTRLCDRCWTLKRGIEAAPNLAATVLRQLGFRVSGVWPTVRETKARRPS